MQEIKELIIILKDKKSIKYILYVRAHSQLKGTLRFRRFTPHPHLTGDKRKIARLAIFPNFLRYATKTSFIPNVQRNF
jgi:hypothetical protein